MTPSSPPQSVKYVKADIRQTGLPDNFFDAIIVISTIEHIGMPAYGQEVIEEDGDLKAMKEIQRIVKPGGYIFLTTPFRGKELIIEPGERQYSAQRLKQLMEDLKPIIIKIYAPKRKGKRIVWEELAWQDAQNLTLKEAGIACLILQK
jgi:ubiquinone/menaquinone biosynthesis C-methylase UbiE